MMKMRSRMLSLMAAMVLALNTSAAKIEIDRTWYLAGEAMTVSVTAEKQRAGTSGGSNALIAYAELCDKYGLVAGAMISLKRGEGEGVLELPSSLHSGYYVLSVYTRDDARVSHRLVAVVNPLRKSAADNIEWVSADSCWVMGDGEAELVSRKDVDECETEGHIIKARIRNVYEGTTFKGSDIYPSLGIIGKQIHYFEGKMVDDSTAVFYTYGIQGRQPLVLSVLTSTGVSLPVEMISPYATLLPKRLPRLVFHYKRSEVEARSIAMQRHQKEMTEDIVPLAYDETVLGTKPDLIYNLDEYRQFLTVREVLLEYVLCVSKRKTNGVSKLIVRKKEEHYNDLEPTLVLIDGMPVFDTEQLLNYDARRVHYINIYGGQYTFGNGFYHGILSFVTRSGQLTNYPIERNAQYLVCEFPK